MDVKKFKTLILYEDNHLLVINKESGIPVQNEGENEDSFYHYAKKYIKESQNKKGNAFTGIVHRLDKNVGGVLIFAKTSKAAKRLCEEIANKKVKKIYKAAVEGGIREKEMYLTNFLIKEGRKSKVLKKKKVGSRQCSLLFKLLESNKKLSLLEINLMTGFYHQIRCQLSYIGHPVIGDSKYLGKMKTQKNRIYLHCCKMEIKHPVKNEIMSFSAPLPLYWSTLKKQIDCN